MKARRRQFVPCYGSVENTEMIGCSGVEHNHIVWHLNKNPYAVHLAKLEAETNTEIRKYCKDNHAAVKGLHQKYTLEQDWDGSKIPKVMLAVKDVFSGRRGEVIRSKALGFLTEPADKNVFYWKSTPTTRTSC